MMCHFNLKYIFSNLEPTSLPSSACVSGLSLFHCIKELQIPHNRMRSLEPYSANISHIALQLKNGTKLKTVSIVISRIDY